MSDERKLAGRGRRLAATLVDAVVVALFGLVLVMLTGAFEDAEDYAGEPLPRIVALGFASYFIVNGLLLWRRSQTIGKALLGVVVVNADSAEPASLWRMIARAPFFMATYGVFLAVFMTGAVILPVLDHAFVFGRKRRCLHDLICRTDVVRRMA